MNDIPYTPSPEIETARIRAHLRRHVDELNRRDVLRALTLFSPQEDSGNRRPELNHTPGKRDVFV